MSNLETEARRAHHLRFHVPHAHLDRVFGNDWFALKAEAFARFFGTPTFLIAQTAVVSVWILINVTGLATFDIYPFILLNLAFSLQAAYAAPLILLAQTRQADREKLNGQADAEHREELHRISEHRQAELQAQTRLLVEMLQQNTTLTERVEELLKQNTDITATVSKLTHEIQSLTVELHRHICPPDASVPEPR